MKFVSSAAIVAAFLSDNAVGMGPKKDKKGDKKGVKKGKAGKAGQCGAAISDGSSCDKFRFNTITFHGSGANVDICYPMTLDQWPTSPVNAESMRTFEDFQVLKFSKDNCYDDLTEKVFDLEGQPNMKPTNPDDEADEDKAAFWHEMRELIALHFMREDGMKSDTVFDQIALLSPPPLSYVLDPDDTIEKSAQHVCCDFPTTHVTDFILGQEGSDATKNFFEENPRGMPPPELLNLSFRALEKGIFQHPDCFAPNQIEFVNAQVAMGKLLGWTVDTVSAVAFASKWAGGRPRPQEVAWEVFQHGNAGKFYDVPMDIVDAIQKMDLANEFDFTAYKTKGAPGHPSHPAMHSAGSAISSWLQVAANPSDAQIAHAQHYDFTIAYFRSFAGVHYPSDNRAGLQLGRFILGLNGPQFVADEYGCSPDSTADILELATSKRPDVDWSVWNPPGWTDPVTTYNAKADWIGFTDLPPLCTGTPMSCFG